MDDENILISPKDRHHHHHNHEHRRRSRFVFVGFVFFLLVLFSYLLILGTSLGLIVTNKSIIINIVINGKNESTERWDDSKTNNWYDTTRSWSDWIWSTPSLAPTPAPTLEPTAAPTSTPDIDPGFWMPVQREPEPYQQPDSGMLRLNDRRERPQIQPA